MDPTILMAAVLLGMTVAILIGIQVGLALGMAGLIGTYFLFGDLDKAFGAVGSAAYNVLRNELFASIPLFILMGDFVARSGAARDLYRLINRGLARIPGRLAVATVIGNAVFAAVTGVSIAAASAFSRIAYPQMRDHGYRRTFAIGSVAGSACLGMLIPPSVLLIIWGIVTETSIGKLFIAGVVPGIILTGLFTIYVIVAAKINPALAPAAPVEPDEKFTRGEAVSGLGILGLMALVLGGIWTGFFTPAEAAGIGALGAMCFGVIKGMRLADVAEAAVDAGRSSAPILFLLLAAAIFSRFLALGGVTDTLSDALMALGAGQTGVIIVMVLIWLALGMILDSSSIILLTVPIFAPIAVGFGFDPIAFAIFGILAIEAGLLTPPVGLLVYAVKGAVPDDNVTLGDIFTGATPYWLLILVAMGLVWVFPALATWLPG
jgi:C4-dicarboxylate transporter, DctM subunit